MNALARRRSREVVSVCRSASCRTAASSRAVDPVTGRRGEDGSADESARHAATLAHIPMEYSSRTCGEAILGTDLSPALREEKMATLLEFFKEEDIVLHAGVRPARRGATRYALRATQDLEEGEVVLSVPRRAWYEFSSERAVQGAEEAHPMLRAAVESVRVSFAALGQEKADDLAGVGALAVSLISAAKTQGFYYGKPVVENLPRVREAETPVTWHLSEFGELVGTQAWEAVLAARQTAMMLHAAMFGVPRGDGKPDPAVLEGFGDQYVTREEMAWALAMINSRAGNVRALKHSTTLIPGMDLFRRGPAHNCDAAPLGPETGDRFDVRVQRAVEAGEDLVLPLPAVPASTAFGIYGSADGEDEAVEDLVRTADGSSPPSDPARAAVDSVPLEALPPGGDGWPDPRVPVGAMTAPVLSAAVSSDTAWQRHPEDLASPRDKHLCVLYRLLDRYQQQQATRFAVAADGAPSDALLSVLRILCLSQEDSAQLDPDAPEVPACLNPAHRERVAEALRRSVEERLGLYPTTIQEDAHILRLTDSPTSGLRLPMPFEVPTDLHDDYARTQRERLGLAVRVRLAEKRILHRALRWEGSL